MYRPIKKTIYALILLCAITHLALDGKKKKKIEPTFTPCFIEEIYEGITGFGIKEEEREFIVKKGGAPTYGEILFNSATILLDELHITSKDVFYDLGCGVGKLVMQVGLTTPAKKSIGIELSQTRYNGALSAIKKLKGTDASTKRIKKISFKHQNILDANLQNATVIFMCATCYSPELMQQITEKLCSNHHKNLRVATLKQLPTNSCFELSKTLKLPMTWSKYSDVFIYTRKA